ncbi:MAG TPA: GTP-binding protein, partial [Candidatus Obscuribacter sp.]|nr:GTP-binding protein [Candidatus Obscuribacter sp.]
MPGKLPVTIFTGFLGSGKTTLLKSLIKSEQEKNFAVVINEFGAVSVDDLLVKEGAQPDNLEIYKLSGGLIAYEGDEFREIMNNIAHRAAQFDHVLIETSGLAAPTAAMEALNSPELQERFSLDATLALIDTPLFLAEGTLSEATLSVLSHQLRAADVVVLNKIDGIEKEQLALAESKVRNLAPDVRFIELAWQAKLDSRLSLGLHLNEFRATEHVAGLPAFAAHLHQTVDGHSHSGLGAHDHGLNTHQHLHEEDPG